MCVQAAQRVSVKAVHNVCVCVYRLFTVCVCVYRLYTVEGQLVGDASNMKTGDVFVAVGSDIGGFKHLDYSSRQAWPPNHPNRRFRSEPTPSCRGSSHKFTKSYETRIERRTVGGGGGLFAKVNRHDGALPVGENNNCGCA